MEIGRSIIVELTLSWTLCPISLWAFRSTLVGLREFLKARTLHRCVAFVCQDVWFDDENGLILETPALSVTLEIKRKKEESHAPKGSIQKLIS